MTARRPGRRWSARSVAGGPACPRCPTTPASRLPTATASGWSARAIPQWPAGLDELGQARPYALWLRGRADLRAACLRSVSMVGSRAATGYGAHVAGEIAADLGEQGLDDRLRRGVRHRRRRAPRRAGHRSRHDRGPGLRRRSPLPGGPRGPVRGHRRPGLVISEWPPGRHPARLRFLVRNRVIAALTCGTVIVEAAERSGALNTARHAADLGRPLMAVPRPSDLGAVGRVPPDHQGVGRHVRHLRRRHHRDALTAWRREPRRRPRAARDRHGPLTVRAHRRRRAMSWTPTAPGCSTRFPPEAGPGPSTIAVEAGVDLDTVLRCLGLLAGCGFIERCDQGWRLRRS